MEKNPKKQLRKRQSRIPVMMSPPPQSNDEQSRQDIALMERERGVSSSSSTHMLDRSNISMSSSSATAAAHQHQSVSSVTTQQTSTDSLAPDGSETSCAKVSSNIFSRCCAQSDSPTTVDRPTFHSPQTTSSDQRSGQKGSSSSTQARHSSQTTLRFIPSRQTSTSGRTHNPATRTATGSSPSRITEAVLTSALSKLAASPGSPAGGRPLSLSIGTQTPSAQESQRPTSLAICCPSVPGTSSSVGVLTRSGFFAHSLPGASSRTTVTSRLTTAPSQRSTFTSKRASSSLIRTSPSATEQKFKPSTSASHPRKLSTQPISPTSELTASEHAFIKTLLLATPTATPTIQPVTSRPERSVAGSGSQDRSGQSHQSFNTENTTDRIDPSLQLRPPLAFRTHSRGRRSRSASSSLRVAREFDSASTEEELLPLDRIPPSRRRRNSRSCSQPPVSNSLVPSSSRTLRPKPKKR